MRCPPPMALLIHVSGRAVHARRGHGRDRVSSRYAARDRDVCAPRCRACDRGRDHVREHVRGRGDGYASGRRAYAHARAYGYGRDYACVREDGYAVGRAHGRDRFLAWSSNPLLFHVKGDKFPLPRIVACPPQSMMKYSNFHTLACVILSEHGKFEGN